jgi:hypothetical protein
MPTASGGGKDADVRKDAPPASTELNASQSWFFTVFTRAD